MKRKPYDTKRLCLLGPESVGKTELATILAAHFKSLLMPEYGRAYDVFHKQGPDGTAKGENWSEDDLIELAKTHIAMREAMTPEAGPLLIEDTDILQTMIWAEFLLGKPSVALNKLAASSDYADHYFVLAPDVEWVDDGVRYAGDEKTRDWFFEEAVRLLEELDLPYDVINGKDWKTRTDRAVARAEHLFGKPKS